VYPPHRRLKARKVVYATGRLREGFDAWQAGRISFAEFDARVQGWINYVRYADTWGLREHVFEKFVWTSGGGRGGKKFPDRALRGHPDDGQRASEQ